MLKERKIEKTLTKKSLIVGLMLSILIPMWIRTFPSSYAADQALILQLFTRFPFALAYLFVLMAISAASPKLRFTRGELAFIYSMFIMPLTLTGLYDNYDKLWYGIAARGLAVPATTPLVREYMSPLLGGGSQISQVTVDALKRGAHPYGWYPVPWGDLGTPILFYTVLTVTLWLALLFAGQILSHIWFRVEALAFPLETALTRLFYWSTGSEEREKPSLFEQKFLWVGFVLGFFLLLLHKIEVFWPPVGSQHVFWRPLSGGFEIMESGMSPVLSSMSFQPWAFGMGLITPLSVNFTVSITWIIISYIAMPIMVSLGLLADPAVVHVNDVGWWQWYFMGAQAPVEIWVRGYQPILTGIGWAAATIPLIWHWRDLVQSARSDEYRKSWIGYIVCTVIFLALLLGVNIPAHWALIFLAMMFLQYLTIARTFAETGGYLGGIAGGTSFMASTGIWETEQLMMITGSRGNIAQTLPTEWVANYYIGAMDWVNGGGHIAANPTHWSISGLKVGDDARSSRNYIFIAQLIGLAISVLIISVSWQYIAFYFNGENMITVAHQPIVWARDMAGGVEGAAEPSGRYIPLHRMGNISTAVVYIVSFAFGSLLVFSKFRYGGGIMRYISPISIWLVGVAGIELWLPFLVAFILKLLLTRVGGVQMVDRTSYPLGIGIIVGFSVAYIPIHIFQTLQSYPYGLGLQWW